ncbi:hypothetical protein [Streptomyces collinus]|uniref:hypothetical protein n=1 Tax=Streptomyces collinus TaxID=42684 RepID=UPI00341E1EC0
MPNKRETANTPLSDAGVTAISASAVPSSAGGGYGNRFEEDAFDYPSPSPSQAWSCDDSVADIPEVFAAGSESRIEAGGSRRSRVRDESRWRQTVVRHRSAVTTVAALVLLAGFGLALSTVSTTVTSNPDPGGTAQVSAPKSPDAPSLPPDATLPAQPPGAGTNTATLPPQTTVPPVTYDRGDDDHGEKKQGREDEDHADD